MNPEQHWQEEDWTTFKWYLKGVLQSSPEVTVVFTKADGTERTMKCTLDPALLPKQEVKESTDKPARKHNENILPVYDVEAEGWRSFRIKSIKEVRVSE